MGGGGGSMRGADSSHSPCDWHSVPRLWNTEPLVLCHVMYHCMFASSRWGSPVTRNTAPHGHAWPCSQCMAAHLQT